MRIKRLEIQGFKSFADRTTLHFADGITGVIGPNGCGKSNIVDALRWAMGEQSAKHLRGTGMEDVIFSGSDSRGPSGFAEVTVTFKNDGALVPPEYRGVNEISIARRLFRDGTSEYLINRSKCRLRDITDLFLGTGVGTKSYAIIEQGRIGMVVTSKPEDRRSLIEDAAGITKYKSRRKQAERKLDAAEQNLLRVTDIVDELKARLSSLEKQAKKAEKYKRIKAELKQLDLHSAAHRYLELFALEAHENSVLERAEGQLSSTESHLASEEKQLRSEFNRQDKDQERLRDEERALSEIEQALAVGEKNTEHLQRELSGLEDRRYEADQERKLLEAQRALARSEREELISQGVRLESTKSSEADSLVEQEGKLVAIDRALVELETEIGTNKQALVDCLTAIAQHEQTVKSLSRATSESEGRIASFKQELNAAEREADDAERAAKDAKKRLEDNRQLKLALDDERASREALLEKLSGDFMANEGQLFILREELMDKRSRLGSLIEIQRNYEGCQAGVRAIMKQAKETEGFLKKQHGLVADVVSAEPRYETAVEALLGDRLQGVIVESQTEGVTSVNFLRQRSDGRSSFIPLDLREDHVSWAPRKTSLTPRKISDRAPPKEIEALVAELREAQQRTSDIASRLPVPELVFEDEELWPDLNAPGVCGKLLDLVQAQRGYERVAYVLLGDAVVVEDLEVARKLWRNNGHRKTFVTLAGEVLDPVGILTGGSSLGAATGMLAKKREIKELEDAVEKLEKLVQRAEAENKRLAAQVAELEDSIQGLVGEGHKEDLSIVTLEADLRAFEAAALRHQERRRIVLIEIEKIELERRKVREESERSSETVHQLAATQRAETEKSDALRAQHDAARLERAQLALRVTELKVALAQAHEKQDGSRRNLTRIEQQLAELDERSKRLSHNIETSQEEARLLKMAISGAADEGVSLGEDAVLRRERVAALRSEVESNAAKLRERDEHARQRRQTLDGVRNERSRANLKLREHQIARDSLLAQIEERYQIALPSILGDFHLLAPLGPKDEEQRKKLRRKIDGMGEINLTAIEEFEVVKERYDFLAGQKRDLDKAIAELKLAIRKINRTSQDRFLETFHLVNEKFELVFPRLFGGGKASLKMLVPSDPLESGIEMLVQPPGKKPQTVNLLSGGEKALTAVALIFAIFLIKPTPFCLLDEVDAPLDDANVGRYNEIVRDMSSISQFILITHNKRTMEIPERIYGITMEEPGISRVVGVDILDTERSIREAS